MLLKGNVMKAKIATALLFAAVAGSALAESPTVVTEPFASSKSRAEVQAELHAYKSAGVNPWSTSYNPLAQFKSGISREQVTAQYVASRAEANAIHGEDSGSSYFAQGHSPRTLNGAVVAGQPVNAQ